MKEIPQFTGAEAPANESHEPSMEADPEAQERPNAGGDEKNPEALELEYVGNEYSQVLDLKDRMGVMQAETLNTTRQLETLRQELGSATETGSHSENMLSDSLEKFQKAEQNLALMEKRYLGVPEGSPIDVIARSEVVEINPNYEAEIQQIIIESKVQLVEARRLWVESYVARVKKSLLARFLEWLLLSENERKARELMALKVEKAILSQADVFIEKGGSPEVLLTGVTFDQENFEFGNERQRKQFVDNIKIVMGNEAKALEAVTAPGQIEDQKSEPAAIADSDQKQIGMGDLSETSNSNASGPASNEGVRS